MTIVRRATIALTIASLAGLAGCGVGGSCGNLLTILAKIGPDKNIGSLSACEWQVLFTNLPSLADAFGVDLQGATLPELNDEQAQAIVDFLAANNITTLDSLFNAVESDAITPDDIPPALLELFSSSTSSF